eukprot:comp22855_c0_seq1/m.36048 comp22855_c0_seq1/g.36048  ORF comp22855_c0_seq1/g.36048 comp22855_c0_seq1/m.36048 type:complete len:167 (-) comp22855_c0_seq1:831-1331(-)
MAPHQSGEQSGELLEGPFSDVFEAVLWDVDGTLIDSEPVHYKCASGMLADYGYHLSEDEYNSLVGQNTLEFFELYRYKCPKFPKEKSNVELAEEAGQRFAAMVSRGLPLLPVQNLSSCFSHLNVHSPSLLALLTKKKAFIMCFPALGSGRSAFCTYVTSLYLRLGS